ncbi:MAG TPA: S8 family serine peptidase [Gallionella sp.]|nr:S8 family serine peptidase [Gallionella sp.]
MREAYYYRQGQKVPVIVLETVRVIHTEGERSAPAVKGWTSRPITNQYTLLIREDVTASAERSLIEGSTLSLLQDIVEKERSGAKGERSASTPIIKQATQIERPDLRVFPVASHVDGGGALLCSGDIVAQFRAETSPSRVEQIANSMRLFIDRRLSFLPNGYVFRISGNDDPFDCANRLVEQGHVLWAHPVFLEHVPERNGPALLAKQWHLQNTGQQGGLANIDISAYPAWSFTQGTSNIVACVIDSGVNVTHESFSTPGKIVPGYDFQDNDSDPSPTTSSHGTSCAALMTADPTSGQVSGVAPSCRLMPIRRPGVTNYLSLAEAFGWAADHGADVISCSFGIDGRDGQRWILPDVARAALDYVANHGRGGKGCPIFWAAGNGAESVSTDEWASSEFTIAVAASTDQGIHAPYSDVGPELSICAPSSGGVSGIVTAQNNGYTFEFGGTSAASPIAAGIACLVLSLAPNLRGSEIRELLEKTAKRIDPKNGAYDNQGHSAYYGYGQVDAMAALRGIPALLEVERATATQGMDAGIRRVLSYLNSSNAGQVIVSFLSDRRLSILAAMQASKAFCDALGRILRVVASIGAALDTGGQGRIPDEIWPDVELACGQMITMKSVATSKS